MFYVWNFLNIYFVYLVDSSLKCAVEFVNLLLIFLLPASLGKATQAGGIDSLNSIPGFLKSLKIRALYLFSRSWNGQKLVSEQSCQDRQNGPSQQEVRTRELLT
jgi:hypothetical protein